MKRVAVALLTAVSLALLASAADESTGIGLIDFHNTNVKDVLPLYKSISRLELFVDSRVYTVGRFVNLRSSAPLSRDEALKLIEKTLLDQASVVITRLDDKRVSVTYNDALPIAPRNKSSHQ